MSIRRRLLLALAALTAVGMWALVAWLIDGLRPRYLESMEESMVDSATILAETVAQQIPPGADGPPPVGELRSAYAAAAGRRFTATIYGLVKERIDLRVYVVDARGTVVFDSDGGRDEGSDYSRWNDVARTLAGSYGARATRVDPADETSSALHVAAPIRAGDRIVGALTVVKSVQSVAQLVAEARRALLTGAAVFTVAIGGAALALTVWATRPIVALTVYAERLRRGEAAIPPRGGPSEVRALAAAFEAMVATIEGRRYAERYLQQLIHELKSPLSSIRGAAELLAEDPPAADRVRFLATISGEALRLQALIDLQLQLAAIESRGLGAVGPVDVGALVDEVLAALAGAMAAKDLRGERTGVACAPVRGDAFLVRQALANLAQNAIDFAPRGSAIGIDVARAEGVVTVAIADRGPGVPAYARDKVFDRFYSLPRPDTGRKSTGLGLTFVREVAILHLGSADLTQRAGGGTVAILRLAASPRD